MKNQVTTICKQAERFAEITKKAIITGNIVRAKNCLAFAERLFETGSNETKNVISNVYVFFAFLFYAITPLQHFQSVSKIIEIGIYQTNQYLRKVILTLIS